MSHSLALLPVKDATCHLPRLGFCEVHVTLRRVFKKKHVNCGNPQGENVTLPSSK